MSLNSFSQISEYSISIKARKSNMGRAGQPDFQDYITYPTRVIETLNNFQPGTLPSLNKYGGRSDKSTLATGYFHVKKINGRWWSVDPDGNLFIHKGIAVVGPGPSVRNKAAFVTKFGTNAEWMKQTHQLMLNWGFNGTGAWSSVSNIRSSVLQPTQPLVYTLIYNFMLRYAETKGNTENFPNGVTFVFDPEFATFCTNYAKQLSTNKTDKNLFGYFSDNELPFPRSTLDIYLRLSNKQDPGYLAAKKWIDDRGILSTAITDAIRREFLGYVVDKYYAMVSAAIKANDPNHMYLGTRFNYTEREVPQVLAAAGKYADIISINMYHEWTPIDSHITTWESWSGKPFLVSEFYTKGQDSGLPNISGAGWEVETQENRGKFYQNFTLKLLQSKNCVGWNWFNYQDNDPVDNTLDASNADANKGVVDNDYEPYTALVNRMTSVNQNVYALADYFDGLQNVVKVPKPGNLMVYRYGSGASVLTNKTVPVFLDEYSPSGTGQSPGFTLAIPTVTNGSNFRLTGLPQSSTNGQSNVEGLPTLSQDGQYLTIFGYDQDVNNGTTSTADRVIGRIDELGNINTTTKIEKEIMQPRCAIANGDKFWIVGLATGIRFQNLGNITSSTQVNSQNSANRSLTIFNNKLYVATGGNNSFNFVGLPETSSALSTISLPAGATANNQYILFDMDDNGFPDLLYMADDGGVSNSSTATGEAAALRKYKLNGNKWAASGFVTVAGVTNALKSITGKYNKETNSLELYGVTWGNAGHVSTLLKFVDTNPNNSIITPANTSPEVLATAVANTTFRGVTFSPGTVLNNELLPVKLGSFLVKQINNAIVLNWQTSSEQNNSRFDIQKSSDGILFKTIGSVIGAGTSTEIKSYSFTDTDLAKGTYYYRLKQVDFNGMEELSPLRAINIAIDNLSKLVVYPNPASKKVYLSGIQKESTGFKIWDNKGRIVQKGLAVNREINLISGLISGIYFLELQVQGEPSQIRRIMITGE